MRTQIQQTPALYALPMIVALWLVASGLLAGGVVLAMALGTRGDQAFALAVLFAALLGYGVIQKRALLAAHDYADARRAHHRTPRKPLGHATSTLPRLVIPPVAATTPIPRVPAHQNAGPVAVERDVTALATSVGVYRPRHGCDTETTAFPTIRQAGAR